MRTSEESQFRALWATAIDVATILVISIVAECAHFSWRDGRHVICADSVQYVDGAYALLGERATAHFDFRKPGYSLVLAATHLISGNMAWSAVAVNHLFQALLPIAAYGLGRHLRGRLTAWLAAMVTVALLLGQFRAERIMSEAVYTTVFSFGVLVFAVALGRRSAGLMLVAGLLLGWAWFTRSIAIAALLAGAVCVVWMMGDQLRRAFTCLLGLVLPVFGAFVIESGLNSAYLNRFRPCTGTLGVTLLMRARYYEGFPFQDTRDAACCLAWLPERTSGDAYRANMLDAWVAWHRAVQEHGLNGWEVDATMKRAASEMLRAKATEYLGSSATISFKYLFRTAGNGVQDTSADETRSPILLPGGADRSPEAEEFWYAYWALPRRSPQEAASLVESMRQSAEEKAPFASRPVWSSLRYLSRTPAVLDSAALLAKIGVIWPGFALAGCGLLGIRKKTCAFLAIAYVLDAVLISATAVRMPDLKRYQYVWICVDTVLASSLVAPLIEALVALGVRSARGTFGSRRMPTLGESASAA